jgi:hypothetical protein
MKRSAHFLRECAAMLATIEIGQVVWGLKGDAAGVGPATDEIRKRSGIAG